MRLRWHFQTKDLKKVIVGHNGMLEGLDKIITQKNKINLSDKLMIIFVRHIIDY